MFQKLGLLYAVLAFLIWGFFPIVWKSLGVIPTLYIFSYRIAFSFCFLLVINILSKKHPFRYLYTEWSKNYKSLVLSTFLIGCNWYTFLVAVNSGHIRQGSLGYYLNPLLNVLLGFFFLKEKISKLQLYALLFGSFGGGFFLFSYGIIPIYSFILALTFALYALVRRKAKVNGLAGITFETLLTLPLALFFIYKDQFVHSVTHKLNLSLWLLLIVGGALTAIALWLFGEATRRVNLGLLGLMQYLSPTLQFIIAIYLYAEPINTGTFIGFCLIWCALILVSMEQINILRKKIKHGKIAKSA